MSLSWCPIEEITSFLNVFANNSAKFRPILMRFGAFGLESHRKWLWRHTTTLITLSVSVSSRLREAKPRKKAIDRCDAFATILMMRALCDKSADIYYNSQIGDEFSSSRQLRYLGVEHCRAVYYVAFCRQTRPLWGRSQLHTSMEPSTASFNAQYPVNRSRFSR